MQLFWRRLWISLLVCLTVFRGGLGNAMAIEMSTGGHSPDSSSFVASHATKNVAADDMPMGATDSFRTNDQASAGAPPCHEAMAANDDEAPSASQCAACEACHASTCTPPELRSSGDAVRTHEAPTLLARIWRSAERAASFKPPVF